ncbi:MAG: hypothetical protein O2890_09275 [Cyanobacteria bacterium]|nr:hypothetical protein [Cyanobacteriota bacterium]MDA0866597.1 hypothetical protein [Cyanobacteriota bacterium]
MNILAEVKTLNLALKAEGYRVAIQARGKRLSLVATLPPKPGNIRHKPYQQRIALHLGASRAGLRRAKAMAILLADQMDRDRFDWSEWTALNADDEPTKTAGEWIEALRLQVWPDLPDEKQFNWQKRWLYFGLNKLPPDRPLTPEALITVALAIPEAKSAMRDRTCRQLQRLAKFAGVDVDLAPFRTGYNPSAVAPKTIPTDAEIEAAIASIDNPQWRNVFALMATYGLRNHEAFLCTLENRDGVTVAIIPDETKTGQHIAYPYPAHWVDLWLQGTLTRPKLTVRANEEYGGRAASAWRERHLPGTPYALRHAYAIRCHVAGVKVAIAAAWMGHSPDMHLKTYQKWISEKVHRQAWKELQSKGK